MYNRVMFMLITMDSNKFLKLTNTEATKISFNLRLLPPQLLVIRIAVILHIHPLQ